MDLKYLETIRLAELERVLAELKNERPESKGVLLEIGAGSGWQAKKMAESGYSVKAIDLKDSNYLINCVWPISDYDGKHIPFPDNYFDLVFSSNVLEHIPHLKTFQFEIRRVLKSDGIVIHVVPSGSWSFWSNIMYYPSLFKTAAKIIYAKMMPATSSGHYNKADDNRVTINKLSEIEIIKQALFPPRHGTEGNVFNEIYYFSKRRWYLLFESTEWKIKRYSTNNLFYTGYMIFGSRISIRMRTFLSRLLGSSCHIFVLTRADAGMHLPVSKLK